MSTTRRRRIRAHRDVARATEHPRAEAKVARIQRFDDVLARVLAVTVVLTAVAIVVAFVVAIA